MRKSNFNKLGGVSDRANVIQGGAESRGGDANRPLLGGFGT